MSLEWKTCEYAAYNGHLECLKYAHENGCPLDEDTFENADFYEYLECLNYLIEKKCPGYEKYIK